jgi:hypothetical protein
MPTNTTQLDLRQAINKEIALLTDAMMDNIKGYVKTAERLLESLRDVEIQEERVLNAKNDLEKIKNIKSHIETMR